MVNIPTVYIQSSKGQLKQPFIVNPFRINRVEQNTFLNPYHKHIYAIIKTEIIFFFFESIL